MPKKRQNGGKNGENLASVPVAVRFTQEQTDKITALGKKFSVSNAVLIRWGVEAFLDHVEEAGGTIMLPFKFYPPAPSAGAVVPRPAED